MSRMRIAVIGGGISGMTAALIASQKADVTLYEKENSLGGHAHTHVVKTVTGGIPVDTGFMVFNPLRYPVCIKLFAYLGVHTVPTSMSLSVSTPDAVYSSSYRGLFAHVRTCLRPAYWRMVYAIPRFHRAAHIFLRDGDDTMSLETFLETHHFSQFFRRNHLYPLLGAVWSCADSEVATFPARSTFAFLENHCLLSINPKTTWHTISGGSCVYVDALQKKLEKQACTVVTRSSVQSVARHETGVNVTDASGTAQYDYVIFATHADTALALLADATDIEQDILSAFTYSTNDVVLHGDASALPASRHAVAAWNCGTHTKGQDLSRPCVTYNMNILQHIDEAHSMYVTLNTSAPLDETKIYARYTYAHPHYSTTTLRAQQHLGEIQNKNRTLYCGAHWGYGFHEDGARSAVDALAILDMHPPWALGVH